MELTGTFKQKKGDYRDAGFDPGRCPEPLYFFQRGKYVPLDGELHGRIARGEVTF